jgi:hypothetical protein
MKKESIELGKAIDVYQVGPSHSLDELGVRIKHLKKDKRRIEKQIYYLQSLWEEIEQQLSYFQSIIEKSESN